MELAVLIAFWRVNGSLTKFSRKGSVKYSVFRSRCFSRIWTLSSRQIEKRILHLETNPDISRYEVQTPPKKRPFLGGVAFRSKIVNFWDIDKIFETEKLDRVSDMEKNFGQHLVNTCWLNPFSKKFIGEKRRKSPKIEKTFFQTCDIPFLGTFLMDDGLWKVVLDVEE